MSQKKLLEIKTLIEGADVSLQQARSILAQLTGDEDKSLIRRAQLQGDSKTTEEGQVVEGVFDGQGMIGPDGKEYSIASNYASKSKLVEGDLLKLTIDSRGNFIYKQIGPIERTRIKGKLMFEEKTEEWRVLADGKAYKVLLASVTYFKGNDGDEVVIVVPKDKSSTWAAVENIIKNPNREPDLMQDSSTSADTEPERPSVSTETLQDTLSSPDTEAAQTETDSTGTAESVDFSQPAVPENPATSDFRNPNSFAATQGDELDSPTDNKDEFGTI